jgi:prepilin-type processing-associated H-X9-DG protein
MSLKDWEETGGKPQSSSDTETQTVLTSERAEFGTGPRFNKQPYFDPITRRRLLELAGVFLVVAGALYVMIPVFIGTAETSRRSVCASHLHRLVQSARMYEVDFDGLPPTRFWTFSMYQYVLDPGRPGRKKRAGEHGLDALFCPSEENLPQLKRQRAVNTSSYTYVNPRDRGLVGDETTIAVFWDRMGGIGRAAHPGGGNVAYLDGHVAWLPAQRWTAGDLP